MESPRLPSSDAIAAKYSELKAMNDTELRAQLSSFGTHLAKQNADPLDEKAFRTVLDNGAYPGTLKRDDAIAELMKLYMRQQLGTLPRRRGAELTENHSLGWGKGTRDRGFPSHPQSPLSFPKRLVGRLRGGGTVV